MLEAWRALTADHVIGEPFIFYTLLSSFSFPDSLLLGAEYIEYATRNPDKEEYIEGHHLVDRTRSEENHPCVGLLQINPYELCGDRSPHNFIYTVLENCARFIPRITDEHPDAARNLCPCLTVEQIALYGNRGVGRSCRFLAFLVLCPGEFEKHFMSGANVHNAESPLVSFMSESLMATSRLDRLALVKYVQSRGRPAGIHSLFDSVCKRDGSVQLLPDLCASYRVKSSRGGTVRK
jgi:hypothetical protein